MSIYIHLQPPLMSKIAPPTLVFLAECNIVLNNTGHKQQKDLSVTVSAELSNRGSAQSQSLGVRQAAHAHPELQPQRQLWSHPITAKPQLRSQSFVAEPTLQSLSAAAKPQLCPQTATPQLCSQSAVGKSELPSPLGQPLAELTLIQEQHTSLVQQYRQTCSAAHKRLAKHQTQPAIKKLVPLHQGVGLIKCCIAEGWSPIGHPATTLPRPCPAITATASAAAAAAGTTDTPVTVTVQPAATAKEPPPVTTAEQLKVSSC